VIRNRLAAVVAAVGVLGIGISGIAVAEKATTVKAGNLVFTINGGVTPKALPKKTMAPITLSVEGKISAADATHPPALVEAIVDTDKNGSIDARGVPTCKQGELEARTTAEAEKVCKDAIVGTGYTNVELQFPESKPLPIKSKLLALNGGTSGGKTTIFIHAYLSNPVSAALVTTVKVAKVKNGRYGIRSTATIPKIAGGDGSVTSFGLKFPKKLFAFKGSKHGYLLAKCSDGHFDAEVEARFANGDRIGPGKIVRACTPKG
jgi:hypothetical protein